MNPIFENLYATKELQSVLLASVCEAYGLTLTEVLVLLYLSKSKESDTATDIVDKLKIAKSHISASVRDLEVRGYVRGIYEDKNRRSIHLQLCEKSTEIVKAGEQRQQEFLAVICRGFEKEELEMLNKSIRRMTGNINQYLSDNGSNKGGNT